MTNDRAAVLALFRFWSFRPSFVIGHLALIFRVQMNMLINLSLALFVLVSLVMVLVILMQRPKSEGLGAAFGGGVTENIFGAQTTNVLVKFTTWLAGTFFAITLALSILYAHRGTGGESAFRRELMKSQAAPQTSPAPTMASQPSSVSSPAPTSGTATLPESSATPQMSPTASVAASPA